MDNLRNHVEVSSTLYTDDWKAYNPAGDFFDSPRPRTTGHRFLKFRAGLVKIQRPNSNPEEFQVSFHGRAVDDGSIDARDLASSILALGELVDQATGLVTIGGDKGHLRVRASNLGSFEIDFGFQIARSLTDFFSSKEVDAFLKAKEILAIVGIGGTYGLIQYLKYLKGREPTNVTFEQTETELTVDGMQVSHKVQKLYDNPKARSAVAKFTDPLRQEGIDEMRLSRKGEDSVSILGCEVDYFDPPVKEEDTVENTNEALVKIVSPSFKTGEKWRVTDGTGSPYWVRILDESFMEKVSKREILFGNNDMLRVLLRTVQKMDGSNLKTERDILEVRKYIPMAEQGKLTNDQGQTL